MRITAPMLFVVLLVLLAFATSSSAGINSWTVSGPEMANIESIAINPSDSSEIYAGTIVGKIFKSTDGGTSWSESASFNDGIGSIRFDEAHAGTAYAAGWAFLYKTVDAGATWIVTGDGQVPTPIEDLVISPGASPTLYVSGYYTGVYASTSGGATWTAINEGLPLSLSTTQLTTTSSGGLFIVNSGQVYRRLPGDASWSLAMTGMDASVETLFRDASQQAGLYAVTVGGRVYKTINNGNSWSAVSPQWPESRVEQIAVSPQSSSTIYCLGHDKGFSKSVDGGQTWTSTNDTGPPIAGFFPYVLDPNNPEVQFLGGKGYLYKTTTGGASWSKAMKGLVAPWIGALGFVQGATNDILIGTAFGDKALFRSSDNGATWTSSAAGLPDLESIQSIAVRPDNKQTVYVGYADLGGISRSLDGGNNWSPVYTNLPTGWNAVGQILIAPSDPSKMYLSCAQSPHIFKSSNGGESWTAANAVPTMPVLAVDSRDSSVLYASPFGETAVYKSTDSGDSWTPLATTGLPADLLIGIGALLVEPVTGALFANVDLSTVAHGIWTEAFRPYRFVNGVWSPLAGDFTATKWIRGPFADQTNPGHYYLGVDGDVYRSSDAGVTWQKLPYPAVSGSINWLAVHPNNSSDLFALTSNFALYRLTEVDNPPAVTSQFPQADATGVPIGSVITISFDKGLLGSSISASSITVTKLSGAAVNGNVSLSDATLTFTPSSPLEYGVTYVVNVPAGLKDLVGTPTTVSTSWQFVSQPVPKKTLTVSFSGSGTGAVKSSPGNLSCTIGSGCVGSYDPDAMVSLVAAPSGTSYFVAWHGACQGRDPNNCMIAKLTSDMAVGAEFSLMPIRNATQFTYYMDLASLFKGAKASDDLYQFQATALAAPIGGLSFRQQTKLTLRGGYDTTFGTKNGLTSILLGNTGPVVISNGTLTCDGIALR